MAKEKADYQKKKARERKVKKEGSVARAGEVKHKVWAEAHQGVDQKIVDKWKSDNQCRNEKPHLEILSKADSGIGYIPRAIEAQTTVRIRTETTSPGSHCGG